MGWYAHPTDYFQPRWGAECTENATLIYNILYGSYQWDIYAVCAILANIWRESTFNPWLWERMSGYVNPRYFNSATVANNYNYFPGGYGLIQWTPYPSTPFPNVQPYVDSTIAQSYVNFSPNFADRAGTALDGDAQTHFITYDMMAAGNWFPASISYYQQPMANVGVDITTFRSMSKTDFAAGTGTPYIPTAYIGAFALNYLRPDANEVARRFSEMLDEFDHWYQYFTGLPPVPPDPDMNMAAGWYILRKRKKGGWIYGV